MNDEFLRITELLKENENLKSTIKKNKNKITYIVSSIRKEKREILLNKVINIFPKDELGWRYKNLTKVGEGLYFEQAQSLSFDFKLTEYFLNRLKKDVKDLKVANSRRYIKLSIRYFIETQQYLIEVCDSGFYDYFGKGIIYNAFNNMMRDMRNVVGRRDQYIQESELVENIEKVKNFLDKYDAYLITEKLSKS